jgi:hypothetical protein
MRERKKNERKLKLNFFFFFFCSRGNIYVFVEVCGRGNKSKLSIDFGEFLNGTFENFW